MTARVLRCALLLTVLLGTWASAQTPYEKLVKAIESRNEDRAVSLSEKMVRDGEASFGLFYNQGLAYRDQGQSARARAAFERALLYNPRDLSTRRRIREIKERLSPEVSQHDVTGTPWWSATEAEALLLIPALVLLALGALRLSGKPISNKSVILCSVVFLILSGVFLHCDPPAQRAVIVSNSARLLEKPESGSGGTIILEGVLVKVAEEKGHFLQVVTREGSQGWVRSAEVVQIQ